MNTNFERLGLFAIVIYLIIGVMYSYIFLTIRKERETNDL